MSETILVANVFQHSQFFIGFATLTSVLPGLLVVKRGIRRGLLTLRREREYLATLAALSAVAFLAQVLVVGGIGVQGVERLLQSRLDLRLQVVDGAEDRKVQEFLIALRDQPFVQKISYVTREQAYEQEKQTNPELTAFLEQFQIKNPFPDTIAVSLNSLSQYAAFEAFAKGSAWAGVVDPGFLTQTTGQEQEVLQMVRLTEAGRALAGAFLLLTLAVLLFVLMELVRRRAMMRREEMLVERLFGAPELSVIVPFATEATALLLAALVISAVLMAVLLAVLPLVIPALAAGGSLASVRAETVGLLQTLVPGVLVLEILTVPLLALGGAFLALRPQMRGGRLALS